MSGLNTGDFVSGKGLVSSGKVLPVTEVELAVRYDVERLPRKKFGTDSPRNSGNSGSPSFVEPRVESPRVRRVPGGEESTPFLSKMRSPDLQW